MVYVLLQGLPRGALITDHLAIELRQTLLHTRLLSFQDIHPIEQTILRVPGVERFHRVSNRNRVVGFGHKVKPQVKRKDATKPVYDRSS